MLAGSWLSEMGACTILKKAWHTTNISTDTTITPQRKNMAARKNTLLTPSLPVFSAQSRDELQRAVDESFRDENRLHGPIGKWDVSQVTDMSKIFLDLEDFDYALSNWDVSRVTNMGGMFDSALVFNQDLSKWDVSRVTDMQWMFNNALSFNQDLSNWDVSRVTSIGAMFRHAKSFNQDLSNWDVSRVIDMQWMFADANSFQQTLCSAAWVNSNASKFYMFQNSPGSISNTVCGSWILW